MQSTLGSCDRKRTMCRPVLVIMERGCRFVTMFAGAFPLAATIACAYTWIEKNSDLIKIVHLSKKPTVDRAQSIGVWAAVIQVCCCGLVGGMWL